MPSKILYDTRDNSIKRCQPEPHGSAGLPSFKGLCKSARIPEDEKQYMETYIVSNPILTNQAIRELRINNGEAILKPLVELSIDKTEVDISTNEIFTLTVNITDTIDSDNFSSVDMLINDVSFSINLTDNLGDKVIELSEADIYIIACNDNRFVSQTVEVVAVE
jgi:hypothetical protein